MRGPRRVEVGFGPLMVHAEGFAAELVAQGYAASSVKSRLGLLDHLSGWLEEQGLGATGLTPECAERFITARRASGYTAGGIGYRPLQDRLQRHRRMGHGRLVAVG